MSKFLGVNISDKEQLIIQNEIVQKLMNNSEKIVPDGADILHELIRGYDSEKATKALQAEKDIDETLMYSNIKKLLNHKISDGVRSLVVRLQKKYGWSNRKILSVFEYCAEKEKYHINYITKVAESWCERK